MDLRLESFRTVSRGEGLIVMQEGYRVGGAVRPVR
jgi:hypothetical protein